MRSLSMVLPPWMRSRWMTPPVLLFLWHGGLTLMLAWWATILAIPQPTFTISQSYVEFARICPDERFWAAGFAVAAVYGAVGTWAAWPPRVAGPRSYASLRMSAAVLIAFVHGMTAIFMFTGAPTGTGSGIYVLIMCSAYLLLRAEYERS